MKYQLGLSNGIETINHAGIYSISVSNKTLTKWADVGGWNPSLGWSPDQRFIAYTYNHNLYVASRQGKYRRIDLPDSFHLYNDTVLAGWLAWSPDGAYIVMWNQEGQLWALRTDDYSWQQLGIPTESTVSIEELIWFKALKP